MAEFICPGTKQAKISVVLSHNTNLFLGCHSVCVANLVPNIMLLTDPLTEITARDKYGDSISGVTAANVRSWIKEGEPRHQLFSELRNYYTGYSIVMMSCPCNTDDGLPSESSHNHGKLSIADFATWLREEGEFIMGSPLVTNRNHLYTSFSLLRAWMWVPTHCDVRVRHIEGTEYISGKSKSSLPFPEWRKFYDALHNLEGIIPRRGQGLLRKFTPEQLCG